MSKIEKRLVSMGAILVKSNRHKVYELGGRRFVICHSQKNADRRDRHKPMMHFLDKLEAASS